MPRGVTDQFLKILGNERRHGLRAVIACAALLPAAYFMAELTDQPLLGWVVLATLLCLAAGAGLGVAWAHRRQKAYNESLRQSWNAWMRMSLSCTRVDEVARHVADKGRAPPVANVGWAALLVANAVLFLALWLEAPWALVYGVMVAVGNGLTLGAVAGHALWTRHWSGQFAKALDDLITEGQVGLWGEV
jgi:protein-S-isoprenylcysteine O-methyltransferase Ste14